MNHTLKRIISTGSLMMVTLGLMVQTSGAQNVGIGTDNPSFPLHVIGTIRSNNLWVSTEGRFDSRVRIGPSGDNLYRLYVSSGNTLLDGALLVNDQIGIGGAIDAAYRLKTYGSGYFTGGLTALGVVNAGTLNVSNNTAVTGSTTIGQNATVGGTLNVTGDGIINNNFRVNGRVGINGPTQSEFALIVNNGNSYFQGNLFASGNITSQGNTTVGGTLNASGNLIVKGNGHVRSNGSSNLRVGFDQRTINLTLNAGQVIDLTTEITAFEVGNSDVRVSICQFDPDPEPQYAWWPYFVWKIYDIDPGANTCRIRIWNQNATSRPLKGILYLMTVAKD